MRMDTHMHNARKNERTHPSLGKKQKTFMPQTSSQFGFSHQMTEMQMDERESYLKRPSPWACALFEQD